VRGASRRSKKVREVYTGVSESPKKEVEAMKGKVKKVTDRGFGFIKAEDGKELFFHSSKCKDSFETLKKDDAVTFEIAPSERHPGKMQAVKVKHDLD